MIGAMPQIASPVTSSRARNLVSTEFLEHVEQDTAAPGRLRRGSTAIATASSFSHVSHVRHFSGHSNLAERCGPPFAHFCVTPIPRIASATTFFGIPGRSR